MAGREFFISAKDDRPRLTRRNPDNETLVEYVRRGDGSSDTYIGGRSKYRTPSRDEARANPTDAESRLYQLGEDTLARSSDGFLMFGLGAARLAEKTTEGASKAGVFERFVLRPFEASGREARRFVSAEKNIVTHPVRSAANAVRSAGRFWSGVGDRVKSVYRASIERPLANKIAARAGQQLDRFATEFTDAAKLASTDTSAAGRLTTAAGNLGRAQDTAIRYRIYADSYAKVPKKPVAMAPVSVPQKARPLGDVVDSPGGLFRQMVSDWMKGDSMSSRIIRAAGNNSIWLPHAYVAGRALQTVDGVSRDNRQDAGTDEVAKFNASRNAQFTSLRSGFDPALASSTNRLATVHGMMADAYAVARAQEKELNTRYAETYRKTGNPGDYRGDPGFTNEFAVITGNLERTVAPWRSTKEYQDLLANANRPEVRDAQVNRWLESGASPTIEQAERDYDRLNGDIKVIGLGLAE